MSQSSRKEKEDNFCTVYFFRRKFFLHLCFISVYSVLNKISEYTYFHISKNITSYTFLLVIKLVESLQSIPNIIWEKFTCKIYVPVVSTWNTCQWLALFLLTMWLLVAIEIRLRISFLIACLRSLVGANFLLYWCSEFIQKFMFALSHYKLSF